MARHDQCLIALDITLALFVETTRAASKDFCALVVLARCRDDGAALAVVARSEPLHSRTVYPHRDARSAGLITSLRG